MNRQTLKKLMVKGTMTYIAVFSLVLMVAMPAVALMANSVGTREIKNHSIRSADIRNKAVTTDRIAPRAVKRGKIGKRAISTEHVNYLNDSKIRYSTKTGYLSIPVAALIPITKNYDYAKSSGYLYMQTGVGTFHAPVQLPQGAAITKIRFNAYDNGSNYTYAKLRRISNANAANTDPMATLTTIGTLNSISWRRISTTAIAYKTVDNNNYAYRVEVHLSGPGSSSLRAGNIVIEYSYASPGS